MSSIYLQVEIHNHGDHHTGLSVALGRGQIEGKVFHHTNVV